MSSLFTQAKWVTHCVALSGPCKRLTHPCVLGQRGQLRDLLRRRFLPDVHRRVVHQRDLLVSSASLWAHRRFELSLLRRAFQTDGADVPQIPLLALPVVPLRTLAHGVLCWAHLTLLAY